MILIVSFFFTLRKVAIVPHIVINGIRKRYMNPFAFLAVRAGLSLLTFNYFEEEFKAVNADINSEQIRQLKASANKDISKLKN